MLPVDFWARKYERIISVDVLEKDKLCFGAVDQPNQILLFKKSGSLYNIL